MFNMQLIPVTGIYDMPEMTLASSFSRKADNLGPGRRSLSGINQPAVARRTFSGKNSLHISAPISGNLPMRYRTRRVFVNVLESKKDDINAAFLIFWAVKKSSNPARARDIKAGLHVGINIPRGQSGRDWFVVMSLSQPALRASTLKKNAHAPGSVGYERLSSRRIVRRSVAEPSNATRVKVTDAIITRCCVAQRKKRNGLR